jgi:LTXXQ motif family protein
MIMKALLTATTLMLAAATTATWAQAPATDPHHPPQAGTPAQPTPPASQPGMGMMGGMPMMNMMGGMPMMHMMAMMRMMGMGQGTATIDRVEGRIAFLRAELKITEAQASAWNAFADVLRTNAQKLGQVRASMSQPGAPQQQAPTLADRLDLQEQWLLARLEGTRAIKSAFTNLYGTLSDDQKKTANELLAPHMGLEMMAMMPGQMPGQMQPGQMQPRQMQPGQMQPGAR